jgi:sterol desaturase/sphingolipid hydroxylase (fatty acid hydroxylase superfamily)
MLPVYLLSGFDAAWTGVVGLALVSYYTFYEFVHYGIHYRVFGAGYMRFIQRYHLFHHEAAHWESNFGNTHPLWDLVAGSYDPAWRTYQVSPEMEKTLVTADRLSGS